MAGIAASPPGPTTLHWARRAGRRGLRLLRPLALPFLHRLEMRIRTAVDKTAAADSILRLQAATAQLSAALASLNTALASHATRLEARLVDRTQLLAEGLAVRTDRLETDLATRTEALRAEMAERTAGLAAELAARTDALRTEIAERTDAARREAATQAERLLTALQRGLIPLGDEFAIRTPDGYLLAPAEDARLIVAMSEGGVLEPGTRRVLAALLHPGAVFVDVGAHIGTMTLLGARSVGASGRVYAIEPTPRVAALLRRSLALNELGDRVVVEACAAGDAAGQGLLHLGSTAGHNSLLPLAEEPAGSVRQLTVPLRRLDDIVPPGTAVDVVKIDTEGSELAVWRGMRRVLAESPGLAAVLEFGPSHLARAGVSIADWLGELCASGFEAYAIDETNGTCRPARMEELASLFSVNLLLLRGGLEHYPGLHFA